MHAHAAQTPDISIIVCHCSSMSQSTRATAPVGCREEDRSVDTPMPMYV